MKNPPSAPYKEMFMQAVNARIREASDTFENAWQICQITHRGTYQAFLNESATTKAANEAGARQSQDAKTIQAEAAARFNKLVDERMAASGDSFNGAWLFVSQSRPDLYRSMSGVTVLAVG